MRDLYFFKRSQYPQLRLVEMSSQEAFNALQQQELVKKFVEIGKVHLTWAILKNVDMVRKFYIYFRFCFDHNLFESNSGRSTRCIFARGIDEIAILPTEGA